jgi:2-hydroxychromene-2-carboxylate isomerase
VHWAATGQSIVSHDSALVARPIQLTATLRHPATPFPMHRLPRARIYASWDDERRGELHGQPIAFEREIRP